MKATGTAAGSSSDEESMPSPEQLKYKVLVRGVAGSDAARSEEQVPTRATVFSENFPPPWSLLEELLEAP